MSDVLQAIKGNYYYYYYYSYYYFCTVAMSCLKYPGILQFRTYPKRG